MIDDQVVPTDQISIPSRESLPAKDEDDDEDDNDEVVVYAAEKGEFFLDELEEIDVLCLQIEEEITTLASRESKQVPDIEALLEAAA